MNNYFDTTMKIVTAVFCIFVLCWTYSQSLIYVIIFMIWFIGEIKNHQTDNSPKSITSNINITVVEQLNKDNDSDVVIRKDIFDL